MIKKKRFLKLKDIKGFAKNKNQEEGFLKLKDIKETFPEESE